MKLIERVIRRRSGIFAAVLVLWVGLAVFGGRSIAPNEAQAQESKAGGRKAPAAEALRLNTLGVAYMNQQKSAEAIRILPRRG